MFLKGPVRIEGLLCCQFFALVVQALIEREIRNAMKAADTYSIPLYPELRDCPAPSAERVLEIFAGVSRHVPHDRAGRTFTVFEPGEPDPVYGFFEGEEKAHAAAIRCNPCRDGPRQATATTS